MCDPLSIALAVGSKVISSKMQADAAEQDAAAQRAAQNKFYADLDAQRDKAAVNFQGSLTQAGKQQNDQRVQEAQAAREEAYQPSFDQNVLLPGQGDASGAVKTAITQAQSRGNENIGNAASRQAAVDAFGDANLLRDIGLTQNAQRIGTYGNFAGGAAPVLQADLAAAATAGDKKRGMADLVSALGTIGSLAAPGFTSTAGSITNATKALGVNNPSIGIYMGKVGSDPFASGLSKLRFDQSRLFGGI